MALKGAGAIRFWGFSPAIDLAAGAEPPSNEPQSPLRMLLVGPGDVRNLLHTLAEAAVAQREGGKAQPLEFSVYESQPEALARQLLLLSIALDVELPRRERAELFLEVSHSVARAALSLRVMGR